ncbi:MAG: PriCT-2 domain-containing protein [Patescibacteria group bacterium]|nr:PriCT-2 domain-containing protein [Patescibacteria group bacterium]
MKKPTPKPYSQYGKDGEEVKCIKALKYIEPEDYNTWIMVGMALKDKFGDGGFDIWDGWSSRNEKYIASEMRYKWNTFKNEGVTLGSLYEEAKSHGWQEEYPDNENLLGIKENTGFARKILKEFEEQIENEKNKVPHDNPRIAEILANVNKKEKLIKMAAAGDLVTTELASIIKPAKEFNFNFDPTNLDGLIGDTVRDIVATSIYKQPELALLNVIAAAGAVFGRRYASPLNARTNLYIVAVARTTAGKDYSRQYIGRLFEQSGLFDDFLGGHYIRSDTSLIMEVQEKPSQIMMLDEFGQYLQAVGTLNAPTHLRNVASALTRLFTSSSSFYDHSATISMKKRMVIKCPNLCIYATTTENEYIASLKRSAIANGNLNRFLVYKSSRKFTGDEDINPQAELDYNVIRQWREFALTDSEQAMYLSVAPPEPIRVTWTPEIFELVRGYMKKQHNILNSQTISSELYGRYAELITKIAMIFAIAENKHEPAFNKKHFDIAANICDTCFDYMSHLTVHNMAESEYEKIQQRIYEWLKLQNNSSATSSDLSRVFRDIKSRERKEALVDMINQGVIIVERTKSVHTNRPLEIIRIAHPQLTNIDDIKIPSPENEKPESA